MHERLGRYRSKDMGTAFRSPPSPQLRGRYVLPRLDSFRALYLSLRARGVNVLRRSSLPTT